MAGPRDNRSGAARQARGIVAAGLALEQATRIQDIRNRGPSGPPTTALPASLSGIQEQRLPTTAGAGALSSRRLDEIHEPARSLVPAPRAPLGEDDA